GSINQRPATNVLQLPFDMSEKPMKNVKSAALLVAAVSIIYAAPGWSLDSTAAENAIDSGVAVLQNQQSITEGSWSSVPGMDYIYTAAAVEALRAAGSGKGAYYSGVAWLENHNANNND